MKNRVVIRSLSSEDGILVAMDDGLVTWKPRNSRHQKSVRMNAPASVMIGIKGHHGIEAAIIGDIHGGVHIITISKLDIIQSYQIEGDRIRSICLAGNNADKIVVGCQSGAVWLLGKAVPGVKMLLFENTGPVSSIRKQGDELVLQSGWNRTVIDWTGTVIVQADTSRPFKAKENVRAKRRARLLEANMDEQVKARAMMRDLPAIA